MCCCRLLCLYVLYRFCFWWQQQNDDQIAVSWSPCTGKDLLGPGRLLCGNCGRTDACSLRPIFLFLYCCCCYSDCCVGRHSLVPRVLQRKQSALFRWPVAFSQWVPCANSNKEELAIGLWPDLGRLSNTLSRTATALQNSRAVAEGTSSPLLL